MVKKRRGLGKLGANVLLSDSYKVLRLGSAGKTGFLHVSPDKIIQNRHQPRTKISQKALAMLAQSINSDGILQPLLVRPENKDKQYELIAGERRLQAARHCKLKRVPVIIREVDDQQSAVLALVENLQREDLSPLDEASALEQLIAKFNLTHEKIAAAIGRSRPAVSNILRLAQLGPEARKFLSSRQISMAHARALLCLPHKDQVKVARLIVKEGWSVRKTEQATREMLLGNKIKTSKTKDTAKVASFERQFSKKLGTNVRVVHSNHGNGKLLIHYSNLDTLDQILSRLK